MPIVDAHHHFWRAGAQHQSWRPADTPELERDFESAELAPLMAEAGVDTTVLVEHVDEQAENVRLREYATSPFVAGVVAWLPLNDPPTALAELGRFDASFRGVRFLIGRNPLAWLTNSDTLDVLRELAARSLTWDVVVLSDEQAAQVCAVAERLPSLRIVVCHLARPPLGSGTWDGWTARLDRLASYPNVALKVSVGLDVLTSWEWSGDELAPCVEHAVSTFGTERCMLASNWPVILLRRGYVESWTELASAVSHDPNVLGATATHWYRL
ncbi:amidohydrolase family protein [Tenggerimyces flavus]|uniref:Amidohydrolase family protein n=1 Tax=Tenggerimyces flavus TaxID=1708749 RepID=A0ABV7Y492_9ACTN|nr:amidohydrolase family protein [Tenggerimyces flavus]MBM7790875.1 L-fuconolactonase [Tenggerimyces flavus]